MAHHIDLVCDVPLVGTDETVIFHAHGIFPNADKAVWHRKKLQGTQVSAKKIFWKGLFFDYFFGLGAKMDC